MLVAWQYDQQSAFQGAAVHFRFLAVFFAFFAFFDAPRCLCLEDPLLRQERSFDN